MTFPSTDNKHAEDANLISFDPLIRWYSIHCNGTFERVPRIQARGLFETWTLSMDLANTELDATDSLYTGPVRVEFIKQSLREVLIQAEYFLWGPTYQNAQLRPEEQRFSETFAQTPEYYIEFATIPGTEEWAVSCYGSAPSRSDVANGTNREPNIPKNLHYARTLHGLPEFPQNEGLKFRERSVSSDFQNCLTKLADWMESEKQGN